MLFQIYNRSGKVQMVTESARCMAAEDLDAMAKNGWYFTLDGKKIKASAIRKMVGETAPVEDDTPKEVVKYSRKVKCINNNKIYANQAEAARDLNIDPAQVSDSIRTGRPRSGYTFERVPA